MSRSNGSRGDLWFRSGSEGVEFMIKLPFQIVVLVFSPTVGGWTLAAEMGRSAPEKAWSRACCVHWRRAVA
jgi:hypothetical protein